MFVLRVTKKQQHSTDMLSSYTNLANCHVIHQAHNTRQRLPCADDRMCVQNGMNGDGRSIRRERTHNKMILDSHSILHVSVCGAKLRVEGICCSFLCALHLRVHATYMRDR